MAAGLRSRGANRGRQGRESLKRKDITSANREAWEEAAPLHRAQNMERQLAAFREPGYSCLDEIETARLRALPVAGKDVAQLCCNNGRELLSVKNLGAGRCVGFDGAEGFLGQARELAARARRLDRKLFDRDEQISLHPRLPGPPAS